MKDQHPLLAIDLRGIPLKMAGFHVPRYTMQTLLRDMDPEGTESRRGHRLRRVYSNPGRIMPGISTGMISLKLSVWLFMAHYY